MADMELRKQAIEFYERSPDGQYDDYVAGELKRLTVMEEALLEIKDRFEDKLSLHKEDCFAYQVATKALEEE